MAYLTEELAIGVCSHKPSTESHKIVFINIVIGNPLTFGADKIDEVMIYLNSLSKGRVETITINDLCKSPIARYIY